MPKYIIYIRSLINHIFGFIQKLLKIKPLSVIVLCYHSIGNSDYFHDVSLDNFANQMKYLSTFAKFITLEEINTYLDGKVKWEKPVVAITFDDGYKSVLEVRSILKQYEIKPTMFIVSDPLSINRNELDNKLPLLNENELNILIKDGWSIGNHSATHPSFANLSKHDLVKEIKDSKSAIERQIGKKIKYFSYPKGKYSDDIIKIIESSGYDLALSMDDNLITTKSSKFTISRIGINSSHSLSEFKTLFTPWVQILRKILK